jgi:hypothetical protein
MIWRRQGANESFRHFVTADCFSHAIELSRSEIRLALANDSGLWVLQGCNQNQPEEPVIAQSPKARDCRLDSTGGLLISLFLSLGLIFLLVCLHNKPLPGRSDEEGATPLMPIIPTSVVPSPQIEKEAVEYSFPGVVVARKTIEVRAPRPGHLSMRQFEIGDRIIEGRVISEYDPPTDPSSSSLESESLPSNSDLPVSEEGAITAPVTGIVIGVTSEMQMDVDEGTLLVRVVRQSDLRISVSADPPDIDRHQACDVWRSGMFLSFAEIVRKERWQDVDSALSLRPLDQFATIVPGMAVDVRCTQEQTK